MRLEIFTAIPGLLNWIVIQVVTNFSEERSALVFCSGVLLNTAETTLCHSPENRNLKLLSRSSDRGSGWFSSPISFKTGLENSLCNTIYFHTFQLHNTQIWCFVNEKNRGTLLEIIKSDSVRQYKYHESKINSLIDS